MTILSKFLPTPTVANVVASFQKTINKLEAVAAHHSGKAAFHTSESEDHRVRARLAEIESEQAAKIKSRIEALLA
jgi:hypothetical protein